LQPLQARPVLRFDQTLKSWYHLVKGFSRGFFRDPSQILRSKIYEGDGPSFNRFLKKSIKIDFGKIDFLKKSKNQFSILAEKDEVFCSNLSP